MKNRITNLTLGCDPELFLQDKDGSPTSAIGLIEGTKESPHKIDNAGHSIQIDNVACEYCIPPVSKKEDWIRENNFMINYINSKVKDKGLSILISPSEIFVEEQLNNEIAQTFGCSVTNNIWTEQENVAPRADEVRLRSCGGHVHYGWHNPTTEEVLQVGRLFDLFLTVPSLLIDNNEKAKMRRQLYGKAGEFRFTRYGIECRTLSNFWLKSEELMGWVYDQSMELFRFYNSPDFQPIDMYRKIGRATYDAINNNDLELAQRIVDKFKIKLPKYENMEA